MTETVQDSIDIDGSLEEIFEVATDFESYPDWSPQIKKIEIKETDADGRATKVWFEVDARIKVLTYTLAYDYSEAPESFSWELVDGDVKELAGSYSFEEFDDVTEVTYEIAIDPGFPVPGILKRQAQRQIVKSALEDLKKRVESG
jgi:ribosome-associated toxin RatA of RatAB toxin-antitoxin module